MQTQFQAILLLSVARPTQPSMLSGMENKYRPKSGDALRLGKEEYLYSTIYILCISQSAQARITQFNLQIHHACLSFVSVHQMAPPL